MSVASLATQEEYTEYTKSKDLSVVHFYAPWAEQCTQVNEALQELASLPKYKDAKYGKILVEDVPELCLKTAVSAVPTVLLVREGRVIDRVDGVMIAQLSEKIQHHLAATSKEAPKPKEDLESRLKKLINQAPCMLFMKGNRDVPRCGFSNKIVSLLNSHNADYQTFDILQDNDVREGLKKFSSWPTYPQLYINGELIGGLDIVKEMSESGELDGMLPKKSSDEKKE